jgi:hypothetical protein
LAAKSVQLIVDALSRAVAEPAGVVLHGNRKAPGLFSPTVAGKQMAQQCLDQGYLRVTRNEAKGKSTQAICAITEKGLAYLLSQVSPKQVLEDLVRTLEARQSEVRELVSVAQQWQTGLENLQGMVERVLQHIQKSGGSAALSNSHGPAPSSNGSDAWIEDAVAYLVQWRTSGTSSDCSLPDLYRRARAVTPSLTIGHFHDGLRRLHDRGQIYLHPWTGPLYEIPEPPYALMIGHEIAYYASIR